MSKDEKKKEVKNNSRFFKESRAELKKVSWPKPKALFNDTATVIIIVLVVAAIVAVLDIAFLWLNEKVIISTEQKIVNSRSVNDIVNPIEINDNKTEDSEESDAVENAENTDDAEENSAE